MEGNPNHVSGLCFNVEELDSQMNRMATPGQVVIWWVRRTRLKV